MASVPSMVGSKRRGYGEDSVYFDHSSDCRDSQHLRGCPGRWRGEISRGFGPDGRRIRRKVSGRYGRYDGAGARGGSRAQMGQSGADRALARLDDVSGRICPAGAWAGICSLSVMANAPSS